RTPAPWISRARRKNERDGSKIPGRPLNAKPPITIQIRHPGEERDPLRPQDPSEQLEASQQVHDLRQNGGRGRLSSSVRRRPRQDPREHPGGPVYSPASSTISTYPRSEERRVGKECTTLWPSHHSR